MERIKRPDGQKKSPKVVEHLEAGIRTQTHY